MHAYVCVCGRERRRGGEYDALKPPTLPFHLFELSVRKLSIILFC